MLSACQRVSFKSEILHSRPDSCRKALTEAATDTGSRRGATHVNNLVLYHVVCACSGLHSILSSQVIYRV